MPITDGTIFVKMTSDTDGIKLLENKFMNPRICHFIIGEIRTV